MRMLFLQLLHMSIIASVPALIIIALRPLFKKAPKALICVLWGFVAIRLVVPISLESPFSLIPSSAVMSADTLASFEPGETVSSEADEIHWLTSPMNSAVLPTSDNTVATLPVLSVPDEAGAVVTAPLPVTPTEDMTGPTEDVLLASAPTEPEASPLEIAAQLASALWPVGVLGMLFYAGFSFLRIHRKVREAVLLRDNIWLCDHVDSPFILGVFRPRILLPSTMEPAQMQHVIAHEQAHLKRLDHLWKPLGFMLLSVYWFNPVLWVAYVLLCRDIELACDEKVIKSMGTEDIKAYSSTLLTYSISRKALSVCPLAFGEVSVKRRIKNVLHYKKPAFWIILASVALCAVAAVCFLTNPQSGDNKQDTVQTAEDTKNDTEKEEQTDEKDLLASDEPLTEETLYALLDELLSNPEVSKYAGPHTFINASPKLFTKIVSGGDLTVDCFVRDLSNSTEDSTRQRVMALACAVITGIGINSSDEQLNRWVAAKDWLELYRESTKATRVTPTTPMPRSLVWLNYFYNREAQAGYELVLNLPEFPDVTFRVTDTDLIEITDRGEQTLVHCGTFWTAYVADINEDSFPDFCLTFSLDDPNKQGIIVYDYANKKGYPLCDEDRYDYSLFGSYDCMYVRKIDRTGEEEEYIGRLSLAAESDTLQILETPVSTYSLSYVSSDYLELIGYSSLYAEVRKDQSRWVGDSKIHAFTLDELNDWITFTQQYNEIKVWTKAGIVSISDALSEEVDELFSNVNDKTAPMILLYNQALLPCTTQVFR